MPVVRYFVFVGGALLALLFLVDAYVPSQAFVANHAAPGVDRSTVRIHSTRKLPERVVYDTCLPTIVPPPPAVKVAAAPRPPVVTEATAEARVRDTFAQMTPAEAKKPVRSVHHKRKIARNRPAAPMHLAQQQQRFGWFGGPGWNSTW